MIGTETKKQLPGHVRYESLADWHAEARRRFGDDPMNWKFVCPSCKKVTSIKEWKEAGASENEVAFSCVGRHIKGCKGEIFDRKGGPCNYAGGGLFRLNPVTVVHGGHEHTMFAFAEADSGGVADTNAETGTVGDVQEQTVSQVHTEEVGASLILQVDRPKKRTRRARPVVNRESSGD